MTFQTIWRLFPVTRVCAQRETRSAWEAAKGISAEPEAGGKASGRERVSAGARPENRSIYNPPAQSSWRKLMQVKAGYCKLLQAIFQKFFLFRIPFSASSMSMPKLTSIFVKPMSANFALLFFRWREIRNPHPSQFSVQSHSKGFKGIQSHSKVARNYIFCAEPPQVIVVAVREDLCAFATLWQIHAKIRGFRPISDRYRLKNSERFKLRKQPRLLPLDGKGELDEGIGMNSRRHHPWVTLAVFENRSDGGVLENFFRDNGIEARTYDDKLLQAFLFLCPPRITFRVQVHNDHFQDATHALDALHPPILEKALHCPSCGSLRVNYPQMTRKFFLPTVLLHLGIIFRVIEHECYCENCHMTWNFGQGLAQKVSVPKPFFPFK